MCRRPGDEFEYALLQVRELIESTMVIHRDRSRREQLITAVTGGYGKIMRVARELVESAEESVDVLHSRAPGPGEQLEGFGWMENGLLQYARDTVPTRLLVSPELIEKSLLRLMAGPGGLKRRSGWPGCRRWRC
ncbi:hypothetical protein LUW77_01235 [Streptomyces radiopugnans]|nr:hypothetical protein LUW77_01235 [Streptomyces radiopugnans]